MTKELTKVCDRCDGRGWVGDARAGQFAATSALALCIAALKAAQDAV